MAGGLVRLTHGIDAWQIVFYRSAVVLVCMLLWLGLRFRGELWRRVREAGVNAVIAGVAIGTAGLVFIIAMFYTTVADAVFMTGVSPFLSAILGLWILRERIPAITWIAMCVAHDRHGRHLLWQCRGRRPGRHRCWRSIPPSASPATR